MTRPMRTMLRLLLVSSLLILPGCGGAADVTTSTTGRVVTTVTTTTPLSTSTPVQTPPQPNATDTRSLDDPPETVDEAFDRLSTMGTLHALTAEVVDGQCVARDRFDSDEPAPIASIFELYVLASVGEAVESGEVAWDDEIVIRDRLRSVPSGNLADKAEGETVTVLEAADLMIALSDNTATDHLIDWLGRRRVEAAMADYGNTNAELNTPLLDTRELTALKVGPASGLRIQWLQSDEPTRRDILEQISEITPGDLPIRDWVEPIDPHLLEWFASPDDLCNLAVGLRSLAESVPEIGEILQANPGVLTGVWDRTWSKSGFEPGLIAAWFVTEADGRIFVTTGSVVNPDEIIDNEQAMLLFAATRDLLAP